VARRFGRREVLRSVSFEARHGEIVGIVGENGAGKSTVLRIVVGLLAPSSGAVGVSGTLGYCDQEPQLFTDLTVAEHFSYFARAYGLRGDPTWIHRRDALLERFAFRSALDRRTRVLSGGTRQKLHLSLALLHRPDVVVLDEPYLAFDWDTYQRFWTYAEELRAEGAALVIVSHLVHDRAHFTRVLELRDGVLTCV